jgi:hypothetical protein
MSEMLDPFPEIISLGQPRLQSLCDEWCREPQAAEFGVVGIVVAPDCRNLDFQVALSAANYDKGDDVHIPLDKVILYLIERAFPVGGNEELRRKAGVKVFQRYKVAIQAYTMALRCPVCSQGILTQFRIFEGQAFRLREIGPVACPACGNAFTPSEGDFFPVPDPGFRDGG